MKTTKRQLKRIIRETIEQDAADHYAEHPLGLPASEPWRLRSQIRDEETRLAKEAATILGDGVDLPSEDTVLDDPGGTGPLLIAAWERLQALAKALNAYKKSGGW